MKIPFRLTAQRSGLLGLLTLVCVIGCAQQSHEAASRFDTLTQRLDALVESGTVPGTITTVIEHNQIVYHHANGYQDIASKTPMAEDTLFRLYSMSKPITSVAIMMLQEQGKLSVSDPVANYLPAFSNMSSVPAFDEVSTT